MRPTVFLGHTSDDHGAWSPRDREMAKALHLVEATRCNGCGQPSHETQDPDREGWYTTEVVICAGCQALHRSLRDRDPEPGERVRVVLDPGYVRRS